MELKSLPRHHNMMPSSPPLPRRPPKSTTTTTHFTWPFTGAKRPNSFFRVGPIINRACTVSLVFVFALAIFAHFLSNLNPVKPCSNRAAAVFFQTGFQAVRSGFSYLVMLAVMSYNGGVFIAAVLGHGFGYLLVGSGLRKAAMPN